MESGCVTAFTAVDASLSYELIHSFIYIRVKQVDRPQLNTTR